MSTLVTVAVRKVLRARAVVWVAVAVFGAPFHVEDFVSRAAGAEGGNGDVSRPEWIFFPMAPPPLGVDVVRTNGGDPDTRPGALRFYMDEPFYAPFSARLVKVDGEDHDPNPFSEEQRIMLKDFLGIRDRLRTELRRELEVVRKLDAATRLRKLQEFAVRQTPRIVALEAVAERLRSGLARRDPWDELREWRLGAGVLNRPREELTALELSVARAAAYYQDGMSPAQRRILREHVIEMTETMMTRRGEQSVAGLFFFFSPDGARVLRPEDPDDEVTSLITRYEREKSLLKHELADTVYNEDRTLLAMSRRRAFESLATSHGPRINALEELADAIRVQITAMQGYERRKAPAILPVAIDDEIESYKRDYIALAIERDRYAERAVREAIKAKRSAPADAGRGGGEINRRRTVRSAQARFDMERIDAMRALDERASQIRAEIEKVLQPEEIDVSETDPVRFLEAFIVRRIRQQAWHEYDSAVLEPGLSPPQRRLLFGAALEELRLPVPAPSQQPRRVSELLMPAPASSR